MASVSTIVVESQSYQPTVSVTGTIVAARSIKLQNEVPGTVQSINLVPGQIVSPGDILVALDVSVEQAELAAIRAQVTLAAAVYDRVKELVDKGAASQEELDKASAEWNIAWARLAKIKAMIERKLIRAPFRAQVGLSDVHTGQYLDEGTTLTTLLGVSNEVYVDFSVDQEVGASLDIGEKLRIRTSASVEQALFAELIGMDPHVDPITQEVRVRARIHGQRFIPGSAVQVAIPTGNPIAVLVLPASAVHKSEAGDHVYVVAPDPTGQLRAHRRSVSVAASSGDQVLITRGVDPGELVASTESATLFDAAHIALMNDPSASTLAAL